jgi:hypothetical protein
MSRSNGRVKHKIVRANPGWHVVVYCEADGEETERLISKPIVAWAIDRSDHQVSPVTVVGGPNGATRQWAIKCPDGSFEIRVGPRRTFGSEAEVLAHFREHAERMRVAVAEFEAMECE